MTDKNNAPLLTLEAVQTHIGAYHILHGVDLEVPRGQLTMLLGRNGAGKTTTLRTIMGLWRASAGKIRFDGQDITQLATPDIARREIAYVPENMGIFSDLNVRDNMLLAARGAKRIDQLDQKRLEWIFDLFPALKKFWLHPAGKLSGGQKQMLAVARAIVEPRKLLLIDEPSKGLAPAIIANMLSALKELKNTDTTILLVEQNASRALAICDYAYIMENGRVVLDGTGEQLRRNADVREFYLGLSSGSGRTHMKDVKHYKRRKRWLS